MSFSTGMRLCSTGTMSFDPAVDIMMPPLPASRRAHKRRRSSSSPAISAARRHCSIVGRGRAHPQVLQSRLRTLAILSSPRSPLSMTRFVVPVRDSQSGRGGAQAQLRHLHSQECFPLGYDKLGLTRLEQKGETRGSTQSHGHECRFCTQGRTNPWTRTSCSSLSLTESSPCEHE